MAWGSSQKVVQGTMESSVMGIWREITGNAEQLHGFASVFELGTSQVLATQTYISPSMNFRNASGWNLAISFQTDLGIG